MLLAVCILSGTRVSAAAGTPLAVTAIDYTTSTITVHMGSRDTVLLMSDGKCRKWDLVPFAADASGDIRVDISWISPSSTYTISFKGDSEESSDPVKVVIPKQHTTLKVSYDKYSNSMTVYNCPEDRELQWKKKESMSWINGTPSESQLLGICANGGVLLFRLAPENGTGEDDPGYRAGKEVSVTVEKKIAAPTIVVDDELMALKVTKGLRYRYCDRYGNPNGTGITQPDNADDDGWATADTDENVPLTEIAPRAMLESSGGDAEDMYIQFYTRATSSKQMSNITTVRIPAQTDLPSDAESRIQIVYTSSTTFEIRIPYASAETPYEYCIINQDDREGGLDIDNPAQADELKWHEVSSSNSVAIKRDTDNVKDESLVYVRRKAYHKLGDADYRLASPVMEVGEIAYPGTISTDSSGILWLQTIAGVCSKDNPSGYIDFSMYSPTNNVIEKIQFVSAASQTSFATLTRSAGDFKSVVELNADPGDTDPDRKYIISTTIMNTSALDSYANDPDTRAMYAYITLEDSTEAFKSQSAEGVGLYIHPASKVNNPSGSSAESEKTDIANKLSWTSAMADAADFATSFTRVYMSNKVYDPDDPIYKTKSKCDATAFRVRVDIGTRVMPELTSPNPGAFKAAGTKVTVEKIKYDGVFFTPTIGAGESKAPFTVEYADTKNSDNEDTRMAVLTINADIIEKNANIDDRNTATPIYIYLSNGEVIKNAVQMNLTETATIKGEANSWSIIEGSLKEVDTTTTSSGTGTVTTTVDHVDRRITLDVFRSGYDVTLKSVKWNGRDVCTNISKQGDEITMDLSNKEINKIDVDVTTSAYLVFEFDNGFTITSGWKLTINPSVG